MAEHTDRPGGGAEPDDDAGEATTAPGPHGATSLSERTGHGEPVDPDVDLHLRAHRAEAGGARLWKVLGAVAAGGALGGLARHAAAEAWPAPVGAFPWAVFWVNVAGCGLIGVLMVLVAEAGTAHPLVRPFLGTGVLGGFTTFSTYAVGAAELLSEGRALTALAYLGGTLAAALAAVWAGAAATRAAVRRRGRGGNGGDGRGGDDGDGPQRAQTLEEAR